LEIKKDQFNRGDIMNQTEIKSLTPDEWELIDIWADNSIEMFKDQLRDGVELEDDDMDELRAAVIIRTKIRKNVPEIQETLDTIKEALTEWKNGNISLGEASQIARDKLEGPEL